MATVKGSWSRVQNTVRFRKNYDSIFRRSQVDDYENCLTPEEAQEEADRLRDLRLDMAMDKMKDND